MKTPITALCMAGITAFALVSCKKDEPERFQGYETSIPEIQFTIPLVTHTNVEAELDPTTVHFNLDSIISANTNERFDLEDAQSVNVRSVRFDLLNGDKTDNVSTFESAKVTLFSNTNATPVVVAAAIISDSDLSQVTINGNNTDLKRYLNGTKITCNIIGIARRRTSKELDLRVNIAISAK